MPPTAPAADRRARALPAVAFVVLSAIVALAPALGGAPAATAAPNPRSVSLRAPAAVTQGAAIVLTGSVSTRRGTTRANTRVSVQERVGSAWRQVDVAATDRGGDFKAVVRRATVGRHLFRAVAEAVSTRTTTLPVAISPTAAVTVRRGTPRRFSALAIARGVEVFAGQPAVVTGKVSEGPDAETVTLQQRVPGGDWSALARGRTDPAGRFSIAARFEAAERLQVRAVVAPTGRFLGAVSEPLAVDVAERIGDALVVRDLATLPDESRFVDVSADRRILSYATVTGTVGEAGRTVSIHRRDLVEGTDDVLVGPLPFTDLLTLDLSADGSALALVTRSALPGRPEVTGGVGDDLYLWTTQDPSFRFIDGGVREAVLDATGDHLAYVVVPDESAEQPGGIRFLTVGTVGDPGPTIRLPEPNATQLSISDDGDRIAFLRNNGPVTDSGLPVGTVELWRTGSGVGADAVTEVNPSDHSSTPLLSGDGAYLTFVDDAGGLVEGTTGTALYRYTVATGALRAVISEAAAGPADTRIEGGVPSADGSVVIQTGSGTGRALALWDPATGVATDLIRGVLRSVSLVGQPSWLRPSGDSRFQPFLTSQLTGVGGRLLVLERET